jgi:hypothetical protein
VTNAVKRVQLDLPEKAYERLSSLKEKTEATSLAEVVKNALRLYEEVISQADAGSKFQVVEPDGKVRQYLIF